MDAKCLHSYLKNNFFEFSYLLKSVTVNDEIIHNILLSTNYSSTHLKKDSILCLNYITLHTVQNKELADKAKIYIFSLLNEKTNIGILYKLCDQSNTTDMYFCTRNLPIVDPEKYDEIVNTVKELAKDIYHPDIKNDEYTITLIEMFYFFALAENPTLNWITIDYICQCNKTYQYLVARPDRFSKAIIKV